MRVAAMFDSVPKPYVLDKILELYKESTENLLGYDVAWNTIQGLRPVDCPVICYVHADTDGQLIVDGLTTNGNTVALDFMHWEKWLAMELKIDPDLDLTDTDIVACILYEMTFHGFDQEVIQEKHEDLKQQVNEIRNYLENSEVTKH